MRKIFAFVTVAFLLCACAPSAEATQETTPIPIQPTESIATSIDTPVQVAAANSCAQVNGVELLSEPWHLEGENNAAELYQEVNSNVLQNKDKLLITYDLHGLTIHEGDRKDESAIIFDQPTWFVISLANYGENGFDGEQTIEVPLSDFVGLPDESSGTAGGAPLDLDQPVNMLHTRFWNSNHFVVDITSICIFGS